MNGIKDTATVTLNVNGAQAKQMMSDIEAKIKQTEARITTLKANMADPKDVEKARKQLKTYQKQLEEMKSATEGVNKALGNLDTATPRELEKALRTLNKQLKDMTPGSEVWQSHVEQIKELKERLAEIRDELKVQESWWDKLKNWVNDSGATILALGLGFDEVVGTLRDYVDAYADMEQEMANVRKFTGMTEEQVASLNEQFKTIDTRSSREQLNILAQEAGRLGKTSEEDVLGFVRAADKINVALDDLGSGATLTLSKLTGIFGDEERYGTEQALLKVGSAINDLSQICPASAPYITDFAERMGGVGAQAGFTIQQILGFGAVLDSNALKVEASATALSQIIVRLYQDPAKYARVAGLEVESFSKLMREDANSAVLLFLETLQKAGDMDVLSPMFKDMGENGSRAITALSSLSKHIDQVKARQEAANIAFAEGTSIDKEFAVQNETVQAALDKCKNQANELRVELGERLYPLMKHLLTSGSAMMRILLELIKFFDEHKVEIAMLTASITAYNIALNINVLKHKAATLATKGWTIAVSAFNKIAPVFRLLITGITNSIQYFTNGLNVNYQMQQRWRAAMAAMNLGHWITLITGLAFAVYSLSKRMNELSDIEKDIVTIREKGRKGIADTIVQIQLLQKAASDETLSLEEQHSAIDKLNSLIPEYNGYLDETTRKYKANDAALQDYITSLTRKYELEGAKELLADIGKEKAVATQELKNAESKAENARKNLESGGGYTYTTSYGFVGNTAIDSTHDLEQEVKSREHALSKIINREKAILDAYGVDLEKSALESSIDFSEELNGGVPIPLSPDSSRSDRFAEEKAWREKMEAEARIAYAIGEASYSEHTARMIDIDASYQSKLLVREDLTDSERIKIRADYWEAVNKRTVAYTGQLVDEENTCYNELTDNLKRRHLEMLQTENLSAEQRERAEQSYLEASELAELNHLARLVEIYDEGTDEWLKAQQRFADAQLAAQKRHQQEYEKREKDFAKIKADFFGDNPEEKQAKYNTAFDALKTVYAREIEAAGNNAQEKLRIEEAFLQAQNALREQYGLESESNTRNSMERAVAASVEWLNSDGGKALTGTLSTLTSGMSSIFSGLSSMIQAELEIQTAQIEKRYDKELQLAQGNSYKVAKLEKKKESDIAKAKNEANKKMFAMQVIQAVAQTAQNALSAYGSAAAVPVVGYILAPIAAAMAVAAGAIQIASIKKQQQAAVAQGYSKGGFTKPGPVDEPAGIVHAGEWVASQKLLANPVARPMIDALDHAQRTNTIGSLRPDDVSRSITANNSLARIAEGDGSSALMVAAAVRMSQTVDNLTDRLNEPFVTINTVTGDLGIKQAEDEYKRLVNNITPKKYQK